MKKNATRYMVALSTSDSDLIALLDRLKETKRLGSFLSAAMESFVRTDAGRKMADVFNPLPTDSGSPSTRDVVSAPVAPCLDIPADAFDQNEPPLRVIVKSDLPDVGNGVSIDFDAVCGAGM